MIHAGPSRICRLRKRILVRALPVHDRHPHAEEPQVNDELAAVMVLLIAKSFVGVALRPKE